MSTQLARLMGSAMFVSRRIEQAAITTRDIESDGLIGRGQSFDCSQAGPVKTRRGGRPRTAPDHTKPQCFPNHAHQETYARMHANRDLYTCAVARLRFWHGVGANPSPPSGQLWTPPPGLGLRPPRLGNNRGQPPVCHPPARPQCGSIGQLSVWLPLQAGKTNGKATRWEKINKSPRELFIQSLPFTRQQQPVSRLC